MIDPENRLLADATGATVWLNVSFEAAAQRVSMDGTRPLFKDPEHARQLFESRQSIYGLARIHVLADNRPPAVIAEEIAGRLQEL